MNQSFLNYDSETIHHIGITKRDGGKVHLKPSDKRRSRSFD